MKVIYMYIQDGILAGTERARVRQVFWLASIDNSTIHSTMKACLGRGITCLWSAHALKRRETRRPTPASKHQTYIIVLYHKLVLWIDSVFITRVHNILVPNSIEPVERAVL